MNELGRPDIMAALRTSINVRERRWLISFAIICVLLLTAAAGQLWAQGGEAAAKSYREFPWVGSRLAVWVVAQLHLMFAAFVLGVPIFAVTVEYIGVRKGDERYDRLAREFTRLLLVAFSITAIFGAIFLFMLIGLYPAFFGYLTGIFFPTMMVYAFLFFGEAFSLYLYYYGWDALQNRKRLHLTIGILLNVFGTTLMFLANAWTTFMMTPGGVDEAGNLMSLWGAINNYTWMPINIHRLLANVCFGGSVVAAYAAFRFLAATSDEERAHYDWMGYVGNFIAILFLLPLPFAGYYLGMEIYAFNQQMGITLMGGVFSWLFIIQAVIIGGLFLGCNYYLWLGMGRIPGAERYMGYVKYLLVILTVSAVVWLTPHSLVASLEEARRMGGAYHPLLGVLGVMAAKNTAVNIMILATFFSFLLYKRGNKVARVSWERAGKVAQGLILVGATGAVIFLGIYGYYVGTIVRIRFSMYQVFIVLFTMLTLLIIDVYLFRGAEEIGPIQWGKIPRRAQYTLFYLALSFAWLMGLMGYARSGIRQHWHVYGILRDTSPGAYTPTLGYATNIISIIVIVFFILVGFVFAISLLGEFRSPARGTASEPETGGGDPEEEKGGDS